MPPADRRPPKGTHTVLAVVRRPLGWLGRILWDMEIRGTEHVPSGALVVAANHMSFIDAVLVTLAVGRNVSYLAAAELFDKHPAFDRLISFFGSIPTHKDRPPITAIRAAIAELEEGRPVGVFPEGRRVTYWGEEGIQGGAAWLALRTGAPLLPVAIVGADATLSPAHPGFARSTVRVWVQPPLDPAAFVDRPNPVTALGDAWAASIAERLDPWTDPPAGRT